MLKIVDPNSEESKVDLTNSLDEIARRGAQMLLAQAGLVWGVLTALIVL